MCRHTHAHTHNHLTLLHDTLSHAVPLILFYSVFFVSPSLLPFVLNWSCEPSGSGPMVCKNASPGGTLSWSWLTWDYSPSWPVVACVPGGGTGLLWSGSKALGSSWVDQTAKFMWGVGGRAPGATGRAQGRRRTAQTRLKLTWLWDSGKMHPRTASIPAAFLWPVSAAFRATVLS